MTLSPELQAALDAAAEAASIARSMYQHNVEVRFKADKSPVTEADIRCESAIRAILEARFPDYGFFGEETMARGMDADNVWLVDPIDGTKAFVREYPMFSTQIALMRRVPQRPGAERQRDRRSGIGGIVRGQPEDLGHRQPLGPIRRIGGPRRAHPRLRRFSALPPAGGGQDRCRDRIRRQYSGHRGLCGDRVGGRGTFHGPWRRADHAPIEFRACDQRPAPCAGIGRPELATVLPQLHRNACRRFTPGRTRGAPWRRVRRSGCRRAPIDGPRSGFPPRCPIASLQPCR